MSSFGFADVTDVYEDLSFDTESPSGLYDGYDEEDADELYEQDLQECSCGDCPLCMDDHDGGN